MTRQEQESAAGNSGTSRVMIFGCGYVGAALAAHLLEQGVAVGALTRNPETASMLRGLGVAPVVVADLADAAWHAALEDEGPFDAVVNCVSSAGGGLGGYWHSYYEGQRSILHWAAGRRIGTCVFTSSTSVYPQNGGVWVDEEADTAEAPETGRVLVQAEHLLADNAGTFGRWFVLRLAGIYGPDRHLFLDRILDSVEELPGRGDTHLNLVHRDDIVSALAAALGAPPGTSSGIYNIADGNPALKEDIVRWLAERAGASPPRFNPDLATGRMRRRGGWAPDRRVANTKAVAALGWRPRYPSYREGYDGLLDALLPRGGVD